MWLHFRNRSYVHVLPICTQQISLISMTNGKDKDTIRFYTWGSNWKPEWDILLLNSIYSRKGFAECKHSFKAPPYFTHVGELPRTATVFNKQCCLMLLEVNCLAQGLSIIQSDSWLFSATSKPETLSTTSRTSVHSGDRQHQGFLIPQLLTSVHIWLPIPSWCRHRQPDELHLGASFSALLVTPPLPGFDLKRA